MNYIDRGSMNLSPYDQAHVALQLMLEVHSMRMQMQSERDSERETRRKEAEDYQARITQLLADHSEASNARDERERGLTAARQKAEGERDNALESFNAIKEALRKCAQDGRSSASKRAAKELERWQ